MNRAGLLVEQKRYAEALGSLDRASEAAGNDKTKQCPCTECNGREPEWHSAFLGPSMKGLARIFQVIKTTPCICPPDDDGQMSKICDRIDVAVTHTVCHLMPAWWSATGFGHSRSTTGVQKLADSDFKSAGAGT